MTLQLPQTLLAAAARHKRTRRAARRGAHLHRTRCGPQGSLCARPCKGKRGRGNRGVTRRTKFCTAPAADLHSGVSPSTSAKPAPTTLSSVPAPPAAGSTSDSSGADTARSTTTVQSAARSSAAARAARRITRPSRALLRPALSAAARDAAHARAAAARAGRPNWRERVADVDGRLAPATGGRSSSSRRACVF